MPLYRSNLQLKPGEVVPMGERAAAKAADRDIAARGLYASTRASILELREVEWDDLPETAGAGHDMHCKDYFRREVWVAVESLWRAGRLTMSPTPLLEQTK